jgi:uncharacterized protein (TIGR02118 family)
MIAAISLMRRLDHVEGPAFRRHWLEVHGPLVCQFAGLRHYIQCHVLKARIPTHMPRIDGFPLLFFDNDADRRRAHGSPEMAACNIDSRHFIGAVSRVIARPAEIVPRAASAGSTGLIILYDDRSTAACIEAHLADLGSNPQLRGLTRYHVLDQGAAPNSTVPHLAVTVSAMAQAWFASAEDLQSALQSPNAAGAALFLVEEHRLM